MPNQYGRCICEPGSYEAWFDNGTGNFTISAEWADDGHRLISEIELYDLYGTLLPIIACTESGTSTSSCSRMFDGEKSSVPFISFHTDRLEVCSSNTFSITNVFKITLTLEATGAVEIDKILLVLPTETNDEWSLPPNSVPLKRATIFWDYGAYVIRGITEIAQLNKFLVTLSAA